MVTAAARSSAASASAVTGTHGALSDVVARLEASATGADERLALSEAYFRLAVQSDLEIEEAIEFLRKAERLDPFHPKLPFHLGRLRHLNGDPLGAVFEYRLALRLAPRSHRTYVHLALALRQLSRDERSLGLDILSGLLVGDDEQLRTLMVRLDQLLESYLERGTKDARKFREAQPSAKRTGAAGQSRWKGLWKLSLIYELSQPQAQRNKASEKKISGLLEQGRSLIDGNRGVSEYALACLLLLMNGPASCREVEGLLRDTRLVAHRGRRAVRLLASACELGQATNAEAFIALATAKVQSSELPVELICCLHYTWYGTAAQIDAVRAAELVDRYPEDIRTLPCFKELRIAILDHHARQAYEDRPDRAEILWRETIALDPFRTAVAHNLALLATRTKSLEQYERAWERAAELRYLLAAAAADARVELDDRASLHRSFAQQCQERYADRSTAGAQPAKIDLGGLMADTVALGTWLREWELYYLNSRLRFHSIVHLLGVPRDCTDEAAEAARDHLLLQFEMTCLARRWAGTKVFLDLVKRLATAACAEAKDPIARKRDPYYEVEKPEGDKLAAEAVQHGLLLVRMLGAATRSESPALKLAGYQAGRALLTMPWRSLEPMCRAHISDQDDVVEVWVSQFLALVVSDIKSEGVPEHVDQKVSAFHDCLRALPDSGDLRLFLCRFLLRAEHYRQAYDGAMEALPLTEKMADREAAAQMQRQLVICIDNAAFGTLPDEVLQPRSREGLTKLLTEGRRALAEFPRAGGLRKLIAEYLIQLGTDEPDKLRESAALLEEGLEMVISDEQLHEFQKLLERAGSRSRSVEAVGRIRSIFETASARAREAVAAVRAERTPSTLRHARELVEEAIHEGEQAEALAKDAALTGWADKSRQLVVDLRQLLQGFDKG